MVNAVLFDLGGTLVDYFTAREFPPLLKQGLQRAAACLQRDGAWIPADGEIQRRAAKQDFEAADYAVRPLKERLKAVFNEAQPGLYGSMLEELCYEFLQPVFSRGRIYDDVRPALLLLKRQGYRLGLVSNTPWGSPPELWRLDLARQNLLDSFDCSVFCGDVGWRKPHAAPFLRACELLSLQPGQCLFVGDHPQWDCHGAQLAGLQAVWLQRQQLADPDETRWRVVRSLNELADVLRETDRAQAAD